MIRTYSFPVAASFTLMLAVGCRKAPVAEPNCPKLDVTCDEQIARLTRPINPEIRPLMFRACLLEHEFHAFVLERRACKVNADCEVVDTWCPFGTGVVVNRNYAESVSRKYEELAAERHKFGSCMYKVTPEGPPGCYAGKCGFGPGDLHHTW